MHVGNKLVLLPTTVQQLPCGTRAQETTNIYLFLADFGLFLQEDL